MKIISPKKTHKNICNVKFDNTGFEFIQLPKIFNYPDIIKTLPYNYKRKTVSLTVTLTLYGK